MFDTGMHWWRSSNRQRLLFNPYYVSYIIEIWYNKKNIVLKRVPKEHTAQTATTPVDIALVMDAVTLQTERA